MQYAILIYESPEDFDRRDSPTEAQTYFAGWMAYSAAMKEHTRGGAPLLGAATATTVRLRDGKRLVQDGPYADTREQLGGFFLIDVPDLDAALEWAARCPASANGAVEVRPLMPMPAGM
jgi:hypothetical protein